MQERTKSRLTLFARLWAVSVVFFLVSGIVFVYACMNNSKNLIGVGAVGFCIMFIVQVSQLIAAIIVRRWWCVFCAVIGLLLSVFIFFCCVAALAAGQYS